MAISHDADSYVLTANTNANTQSLAHTCSGSNRLLIVSVVSNTGGVSTSGVTYAGVSMTQVGTSVNYNNGTIANVLSTWYLIAPAAGTNNIVVTFSGTVHENAIGGVSYTGAHQTTPIDANGKTEQLLALSISTSPTVVASNCWGYGATMTITSGAVGTNDVSPSGVLSTLRGTPAATAPVDLIVSDSNGTISTGSQTMGYTQSIGTPSMTGELALSIAPAITRNGNFLMFM